MFCAADHPLRLDKREISFVEFERSLTNSQVQKGDRIVINGGEPTLHREFFDILRTIKERGAYIDLFTNGIKFSDKQFTNEVLSYAPMYIRIPLFGSTPSLHDSLTGQKGNFDRVCAGLTNIHTAMNLKIYLEIKFLLSKATVKENLKIFRLANEHWKGKNVLVSLNPLLISESVKENSDIFFDSYTELMKQSENLVAEIACSGWHFSLDLIPFCAFPQKSYVRYSHSTHMPKESRYSDPSSSLIINEMSGREKCLQCIFVNSCSGFPSSYISYYGDSEINPITA